MSGNKNLKIWLAMALLIPLMQCLAEAKIIYVDDDGPADFNNIQAAIGDSNDGNVIVVAEGTYFENISFKGKNITLRRTDPNDPNVVANTVIDGMRKSSVVTFQNGEEPNCVLSGFTITHGGWCECEQLANAGICCYNSSPLIIHNIITDNYAEAGGEWGGGIYCRENSSPLIIHNTIMNNYSEFSGGIDCWYNSSPIIIGNKIFGNYADYGMGAIQVRRDSSPIILNNIITLNFGAGIGIYLSNKQTTILNNTIVGTLPSGYEHAGIRVYESIAPIIRNCILWDNGDELKGCTATYSCVKDNDTDEENNDDGDFNISTDPLFADPNSVDYHLKSQAGRWEPSENPKSEFRNPKLAEGSWVKDEVTSLCIDAGDPASPIGLEPFPNGGIINMGAYGGTEEASKSYFGEPVCETIVAGDINGDCIINLKDFALMAFHWLEEH